MMLNSRPPLNIAMLSVHTCPLAALGAKETGGMNVYVRELSRELGRMGVEVDIFTRSQNPAIPRVVPMADSVRVVHLPAGPEAPLPRERVYDHLDEFVDGVEAWRLRRDVDYDLIHAHYWLSGVVGLSLRERWSVPMLQMFHTLGDLKNRVARRVADLEPTIRLAEEARIIAGAERLVAASVAERAYLVRHTDVDPARVAVVPCGVDTELFTPGAADAARAALGLVEGPLVLYVGRLAPIKGLETLLDAVALLERRGRRLRLSIVGGEADEPSDGHEAELRRRIETLGIGDLVGFVGAQRQEALRTHYVAADVTVLPSHYESFGMVALEAMACGSPVVASRVGGLTTTVRDGVTGFLVPEGDVTALAGRLEALLADADLRWRLGREGVRWAAQHRWPCVAEAICREYALLESRAQPHLAAGRCIEIG
jgi:D-inositol-3-phosphate glycosyltransferase